MKHLGMRPRVFFPDTYRGFHLLRTHGRVYAIPLSLDPEELLRNGQLFANLAVLSAASLEELQALIDRRGGTPEEPKVVGHCRGYTLIRRRGKVFGVSALGQWVNLDLPEECRRAGVLSADTVEELQERLVREQTAIPIEFAGWLPVYETSGNCGQHPQFTHTGEPPAGYRFTSCAPAPQRQAPLGDRLFGVLIQGFQGALRAFQGVFGPLLALFRRNPRAGVCARLRVLGAVFGLFFALRRRGAGLRATLRFLRSRHFQSQLQLTPHRGLVFLTSMPYTFGQNPWIVEIEDPMTLFYPLIQNGHTGDLDIQKSPYFPMVQTLLESESCRGILTHMRSTARLVPRLFGSEIIRRKVKYVPLGVKLPTVWQRHQEHREDDPIHLLFINSWCQVPENFFVRGGLDILEAFDILRVRYPQLRLTMRTSLPALDAHYYRIMEAGWVRVINRFLPAEEMARLHAGSHIFLLPAARVHIVSLLQAMSYGLAVVASDGWGIEEYIDHQRNGLIVKGRYGKVSWADEEAGLLREDYDSMATPDPDVVGGLVEAVSRLVEDQHLRARLGRTARSDVEAKYNLEQWNRGLKAAFDQVQNPESEIRNPKSELADV